LLVVFGRSGSRERWLGFGIELRIRIEHERLGIELGRVVRVERLRGAGLR
jgi:hypothetical protein